MNADVFLQIIVASALVLTIGTLESFHPVRFASVTPQAYFIFVASRALIAPEESFLFLSHLGGEAVAGNFQR